MAQLVLTSDTLAGTPATGTLEYNGQFFGTDSNASRAQMQRITQGTAVASTSGTSIDFTSIPAWVKKITVMFQNVSTNGSSSIQMQLGTSGGFVTTGYLGSTSYVGATSAAARSTTGLLVCQVDATTFSHGLAIISSVGSNGWVHQAVLGRSSTDFTNLAGGSIALGGTLDRVRLTTVNGTDTFDAGSVNILYEG